MGIGPEPAQMLRDLGLAPGFSACDLGDQMWHSGKRRDPKFWSRPARDLYRKMGGGDRYESIDANGGGTILADLNFPLGDLHPGQFDLVTDFGTTEHVFNFAQAWYTIHTLTKPGGVIAFEKPHQGYPDHGFYNTHKTVWRDIAAANEYEIMHLTEITAPRGQHWRGVYRKGMDAAMNMAFVMPNQGKYRGKLKI